jgi:hypothetical protein
MAFENCPLIRGVCQSQNPLIAVKFSSRHGSERLSFKTVPTNPAATGSAGPAFEAKVGAACLALLLTRGSPLFLGTGTLQAVHLQAGHLSSGWCTDDILLEATDALGNQKAALQAKRAFTLSGSDEECIATLRGALADFRNSGQFDQQRDVIAVVTSSLSAKLARGLRTLLDCARASTSATDMARRLAIPNYLGKHALGYFQTIQKILGVVEGGAPSEDELWRFLSRFHIVDLDLDTSNGMTETMMRSLLAATRSDDSTPAEATWNELIVLVETGAGRAMSFTREKLPGHLLQRHSKSTGFSTGVLRLIDDSKIVIDGIRTTIGQGTKIPRETLLGTLTLAVEESPLVFVTGAAGSGKSALVKAAFTIAVQDGVGFCFRAVSLGGNHINEVLHRYSLTLNDLCAQTAMHARKVLWIESIEKLLETPVEQRAAFLDLLRALKSDQSWKIIATCRAYSAETIQAAFFGEVGLTAKTIEVTHLSDAELDDVADACPILRPPLATQPLRRLLRNPFYLDKAAQMSWTGTQALPANERGFRDKVWREVIRRDDEDVESGLPQLREQALVEIALSRAKALEPYVSAPDLDLRARRRLIRDSILQEVAGADRYAPAHDVFEDWALMRWLDGEFARHNQKLDSLLVSLGAHPALRRAYRKWLTEFVDSAFPTDSLVLEMIQNAKVPGHWRDDTLTGILQSGHATQFLERNSALLLADCARLLRQIIHILRVACRAAIPRRLFGVDSDGEFFLPKGTGWGDAADLMEKAIPSLTDADFPLVMGFLEDWILLTRWGVRYPKGSSSIAKIAWHWLPRMSWRTGVEDGAERLLKVILKIPLAEPGKLTAAIDDVLSGEEKGWTERKILSLVFNHFAGEAIVRDLPDLAFRVAEHLLGLDQNLDDIFGLDVDRHFDEANRAFGMGGRLMTEDFPASAYNGPCLRMLQYQPDRGIDLIVRFINRSCAAYAEPNNHYRYIERPSKCSLEMPDGTVLTQIANARLFGAYRGMEVTPYCFQSALMALERWLLEKERNSDSDMDSMLVSLLKRSNNVAITAVVASVCAANPSKAKESAYALLTCPALLKADLVRSIQEDLHAGQLGALGFAPISAEHAFFNEERLESGRLAHRKRNLEYVAVILQTFDGFRERVWTLIDRYKAELPPEPEQSSEDKLWRIQLHRIDTRNFVETGRTREGDIILGTVPPAPDLQQHIEREQPRSEAQQSAMRLFVWGQQAFRRQVDVDIRPEEWRHYLALAQSQVSTGYGEGRRDPAAGGPAFVAAVCIRDHWSDMSSEEREWCARKVCDSIEADANATDHLTVVAQNPFEGSRPAAFILPALFGKQLPPEIESRLLPVLSVAVIHNVEETVDYAVQGISHFLWRTDRSLALTCLQALVTEELEMDAFWERQRKSRFEETTPEHQFKADLRRRMRQFIRERGQCNEAQIISVDFSRWPGRGVAKKVFAVATNHPLDPFVQQIMRRSIETLPTIWSRTQRSRRFNPANEDEDERFDPTTEHMFVDAICRFALLLDAADALVFFAPVFAAAQRYPEKAADVVKWLVIHQGERAPAPTLWTLWQRFADRLVSSAQAPTLDDDESGTAELVRQLFLGGDWNEQRDWKPLEDERHRLRALFEKLPPGSRLLHIYGYYLAKIGTPTLPDALIGVASKLSNEAQAARFNETAVFYFEQVLTRLIYGGNSRIRTDSTVREATLKILDALVDAGSSAAYKLRDDFLTPSA